jgi:NifU-like protein involved in Fe-S cluster formation
MPPYGREVMDDSSNPCNMGEIENSDGATHAGNTVCGEMMELCHDIEDGLIIRAHLESKHRISV